MRFNEVLHWMCYDNHNKIENWTQNNIPNSWYALQPYQYPELSIAQTLQA